MFWRPLVEVAVEGKAATVRCATYGMFMVDIAKHLGSAMCTQLARRRDNKHLAREQGDAEAVEFRINRGPIEQVLEFWFLG